MKSWQALFIDIYCVYQYLGCEKRKNQFYWSIITGFLFIIILNNSQYFSIRHIQFALLVIEDRIFDNSNNLKETTKSEYLKEAPPEKYPFDFNRIGTLTTHFCTKEVTYTSKGDIKDSTRYIYDNLKRISKKLEYNPKQKDPTVKTYKYDEKNRVIEQSQYFGDNGRLFYTKKFEYDINGLKLRETWFGSNNIPEWTKEFRY